jgi:hypothetical protein
VDHVMNVPRTKIPEELCIPLIEVTDKMLAHSHTGECISSAADYTNSACVCITFSQMLKTENRTFYCHSFMKLSSLISPIFSFFFFQKCVKRILPYILMYVCKCMYLIFFSIISKWTIFAPFLFCSIDETFLRLRWRNDNASVLRGLDNRSFVHLIT